MRKKTLVTSLVLVAASASVAIAAGGPTGRTATRLPPGTLSNYGQSRATFTADHVVSDGSTPTGPAYSYSNLEVTQGRVVGYQMYFGAVDGVDEATAQVIAATELPADSAEVTDHRVGRCEKSIFDSKTLQRLVGVQRVRVTFFSGTPSTSRPFDRAHIRRATFAPAGRSRWSC